MQNKNNNKQKYLGNKPFNLSSLYGLCFEFLSAAGGLVLVI